MPCFQMRGRPRNRLFPPSHANPRMTPLTRVVSAALLLAAASTVAAQPSSPPRRGGRPAGVGITPSAEFRGRAGPVAATADFLLAHTGELSLTDAQVVRLAGIARRTEARRKALATRLDSARAERPAAGDSAGGRGRRPPAAPPPELQQARDQMRADVRDAIAVLTPDQQAAAWMIVAGAPALGDRVGPITRPPGPRDVPRRPRGGDGTDR